MLDMKFIRENPELVKENCHKKFQDSKIEKVDELIALDAEYRKLKTNGDELRAKRNSISKEIGALMSKGEKEKAEEIKKEVKDMGDQLVANEKKENELSSAVKKIQMIIPNIIDPTVPIGTDEMTPRMLRLINLSSLPFRISQFLIRPISWKSYPG